MILQNNMRSGILLRRYQRFLADVELDTGETVTAHCPNSGSMAGCAIPGSAVLLSPCDRPGRRCPFTWELVQVADTWIGINTARTNAIAREGIENGTIAELSGYTSLRQEVRLGESRIDLMLSRPGNTCFVEVKNVSLTRDGVALFPDAATDRGRRHLRELAAAVQDGHRGVILFVVQREDCSALSPADSIDPAYGKTLREAVDAGVEALAYRALVSPAEIRLQTPLPVLL